MALGRKVRAGMIGALVVVVMLGPGAGVAHAYIDPGTGSSLLSSLGLMLGVVSTVIAICFSQLRHAGGWLLAKIASRRADNPTEPTTHE